MYKSTWAPKGVLEVLERDPLLSRAVTNQQFKEEGLIMNESLSFTDMYKASKRKEAEYLARKAEQATDNT